METEVLISNMGGLRQNCIIIYMKKFDFPLH